MRLEIVEESVQQLKEVMQNIEKLKKPVRLMIQTKLVKECREYVNEYWEDSIKHNPGFKSYRKRTEITPPIQARFLLCIPSKIKGNYIIQLYRKIVYLLLVIFPFSFYYKLFVSLHSELYLHKVVF